MKHFDDEYYSVNKKYMLKLEYILNFNEMKDILKNLDINSKDSNLILDKVKEKLKDKNILDSKKIEKKYIENQLNDDNLYELSKEIYYINNEEIKFYYINCQIINKEILNLIKSIDSNFANKYKSTKCYLSDNKIITYLNENIINIGYSDDNKIFIVEKIIYSEKDFNISEIIKYIKNNGYKNFEKYLNNNLIQFNSENKIIEKNLINILEKENIINNINQNEINEKLKTLNIKKTILIIIIKPQSMKKYF